MLRYKDATSDIYPQDKNGGEGFVSTMTSPDSLLAIIHPVPSCQCDLGICVTHVMHSVCYLCLRSCICNTYSTEVVNNS